MKPESTFKLGYVPMLDIARALAIIIVVLGHANFQLGQNGHFGVDVFFTLSGFLITTLLLEEWNKNNQISFAAFYVRRAFRLFPALFVLLIVVLIYAGVVADATDKLIIQHEVIAAFFYFYNIAWLVWPDGKLLTHTWSLAVEEQFYFLWPWIFGLLLRQSSSDKKLRNISYSLLAAALVIAIIRWFQVSFLFTSIFQEAIFIGVAGAITRWRMRKKLFIPSWLWILSWALLIVLGVMPIDLPALPGEKLLVSLLAIFCIYGSLNRRVIDPGSNWLVRFLIYIGHISYSWYLWHVPIFRWFKWHADFDPAMGLLAKMILSFLLAILSYELLEKKMIKLGRTISNKIINKSKVDIAFEPVP